MPELTEKQKELRIIRFRKIIKYRSLFGWLFSFVGSALFVVGIDNDFAPLVMLNGFLLKEAGVESVVSISQVYKLILLFFIFIRISSTEKLMFISFFLLMLIPSVLQIFKSGSISLIFNDAIKITKYFVN